MRKEVEKLLLEEYHKIYERVPRLGVDLVIRSSEGVLLTKRDIPPAEGKWHIPGGTVLMGETLAEAVERVAREELGARVIITEELGSVEYLTEDATAGGHAVCVAFSVVADKLELDPEKARFFNILPDNLVGGGLREFLEEVL